jgi:hypothetical protein
MADLAASKFDDKARSYCLPDGVPRALESPYPFEIIQAQNRGEIYLIYEINHMIRRVDMQKPLPPDKELLVLPFYAGHSAGHWEGNTLVIETAGYNDYTFLDNSGAPHSDQLRTIERIRKLDDGKTLEDVVTIRDPVVFTKDWTARFLYQALFASWITIAVKNTAISHPSKASSHNDGNPYEDGACGPVAQGE